MIRPIDRELSFNHRALNLLARRQDLLAANIANADTPQYKARDMDFAGALAGASAGGPGAGSLALSVTQPGHRDTTGGVAGATVLYRTEYQGAVDGNTVHMDVERAAFAENSVRLEATLTFLRGQFKDLGAAIQS